MDPESRFYQKFMEFLIRAVGRTEVGITGRRYENGVTILSLSCGHEVRSDNGIGGDPERAPSPSGRNLSYAGTWMYCPVCRQDKIKAARKSSKGKDDDKATEGE